MGRSNHLWRQVSLVLGNLRTWHSHLRIWRLTCAKDMQWYKRERNVNIGQIVWSKNEDEVKSEASYGVLSNCQRLNPNRRSYQSHHIRLDLLRRSYLSQPPFLLCLPHFVAPLKFTNVHLTFLPYQSTQKPSLLFSSTMAQLLTFACGIYTPITEKQMGPITSNHDSPCPSDKWRQLACDLQQSNTFICCDVQNMHSVCALIGGCGCRCIEFPTCRLMGWMCGCVAVFVRKMRSKAAHDWLGGYTISLRVERGGK